MPWDAPSSASMDADASTRALSSDACRLLPAPFVSLVLGMCVDLPPRASEPWSWLSQLDIWFQLVEIWVATDSKALSSACSRCVPFDIKDRFPPSANQGASR